MKPEQTRRDFLARSTLAGMAALTVPLAGCSNNETTPVPVEYPESRLIVPKANALQITGTFLDEISHDIPHQNWGEREWDAEFGHMKAIGIDTVIMIRSGYRKFITFPSEYLLKKGCYMPSVDLVDLYLRLADKYAMKFYFGLYDSGKYWDTGDLSWEIEDNKYVIDEVWKNYGSKYKSFGGWYISGEISRQTKGAIAYVGLAYLDKSVKEIAVSFDGKTFVVPNEVTAKNKTYPVIRPLYFYMDKKAEVKSKPLVDFIMSAEGQKIVEQVGYVPLK